LPPQYTSFVEFFQKKKSSDFTVLLFCPSGEQLQFCCYIDLDIHTIKPTNALMLKLYIPPPPHYTQSVITPTCFNLVHFREWLNISKACIKICQSYDRLCVKKYDFNIGAFVGFIV
jgi:hypothetical protein